MRASFPIACIGATLTMTRANRWLGCSKPRSGHGGVSGVEAQQGTRKFVIDYKGGLVGAMEPDAEIAPIVTIANGEITGSTIEKIAGTDIWRLVIDISAAEGAVVELSAHLAGYDRRLTENWLYQWINAK